jgi:hypothetical protein
LESGAAEAVDGDSGHEIGQPRAKGDDASHITARFRLGHGAANDHIIYFIAADLRIAIQQSPDDGSTQIVGPGVAECAPGSLAYGGAEAVYNDGVLHDETPLERQIKNQKAKIKNQKCSSRNAALTASDRRWKVALRATEKTNWLRGTLIFDFCLLPFDF